MKMAQTTKTPVSILQEMMVRKSMTPEYELIHDGGGTHDNTFTYRVTCDGQFAIGTGRCKKDAKHTAAKNMLDLIATKQNLPQLPSINCGSPVRKPSEPVFHESPTNTFSNAVGELQVLCANNGLELPKYVLLVEEGPAHAKMFTYQCIVSITFKEDGRGKTKQQAKHEAARKMLNRLKQYVAENDSFSVPDPARDSLDEKAKAKYAELSKLSLRKNNLGVKLSEYHTRLKNMFTEDQRKDVILKLNKLLKDHSHPDDYQKAIDEITQGIDEALAIANVATLCLSLTSSDSSKIISAAQLNCGPDLIEIAVEDSKEQADHHACIKLLNSLKVLLK